MIGEKKITLLTGGGSFERKIMGQRAETAKRRETKRREVRPLTYGLEAGKLLWRRQRWGGVSRETLEQQSKRGGIFASI